MQTMIESMNHQKIRFHTVLLAGLAAGSLLLAGCASTPADRAVDMARSVKRTGSDLESSRTAVTRVLTTLNQIVTQPQGDMVGHYKDYLSAVKSLNSISTRVDRSIGKMIANSQVYFADWSNQVSAISDTALKNLSEQRRQQAITDLANLKDAMNKARAAYTPLAKDLDDVGLYLGNNLTASGIAAMQSRLDTIKAEAVGVRDDLTSVANALGQFSATLAPPDQ